MSHKDNLSLSNALRYL